ncbi:hypothetical protein [Acetonema longum]|uniref:DUF1963 domain-containing protein n=1 Tax=Acetonema longum DSM 6540 TaxID=1009370 RepID=F7NMC4_9FIRM|nr:hypothetical protein [Acetonema longum]EGO62800.1 hypothetical protein ALO_16312 [Acetonema longum DSM 6540]
MARSAQPCQECGREIYFEGLCYQCRGRKKREAYLVMSDRQIEEAIQDIVEHIETIGAFEKTYKDFNALLAYHNISTEKIAEAALAKGVFYPSAIYRNASTAVRDRLIDRLLRPDCKNANDLLLCLAMCGDAVVLKTFYELENNPQPWRKKLHVNPSVYAQYGGWSYDENGNRYEVAYPCCYAILPGVPADEAVKIGSLREDHCPVCGCRLVDMLTLDGNDARLAFLRLGGKVKVPVCPNCAVMSDKILVRYQVNGESRMEIIEPYENKNHMDEAEVAQLANNARVLGLTREPVAPFYACGGDEVCTIGGFADWIQDAQYESCPDCGKTMKLLAALQWDILSDYSEGTLYAEICTDCQIITLIHQQT